MKLLQKILLKFNGLHYPQEYLCFAKEHLPQQLHVYLVQESYIVREIAGEHLFVGYCPLVFAFASTNMPESIELIFSIQVWQPNEKYQAKDALAALKMQLIYKQQLGGMEVFYYEGIHGWHHFQSGFHQLIGKKYNRWFNKKPGNVFLHDNLYMQVQIAYAVPRLISLVTVGHHGLFNLFPTDLHGTVSDTHYIISLRTGGKACRQVMETGKIVLSQMLSEAFQLVYDLGKNHMKEMDTSGQFPFGKQFSDQLGLPLPQLVADYFELELVDSFVHGIHTLLLFRINNRQALQQGGNTLVHIHNSYASWRFKSGLQGNFLMR